MPAIKKETLDGDDMALAAFNQSEYLAPLNATAIPVVTPHPPPYDHIFAHHRVYLGLQDAALHSQHLHHPEDLMLERFSSIPDFQPFFDNGEPCIEVECGENKALLYINKLCQGSKGPSIKYRGEWLTPNEFQFVSGRETAKDWKRSIRHKGKSLKTLMSKGILQVHPPICDCPGCRISSPVNRGRLAEKRATPLGLTRTPKRELASAFSSDDSDGCSGQADIKQEQEPHFPAVRKSEGDVSPTGSSVHCSPEDQPGSEAQRQRLILRSTGHTDDTLGKRKAYSPSSSSKKARGQSPRESSHTLSQESLSHMTPEEHYRRMMSALSEPGSYEEQQQRIFQLASSMGVPSPADLLRMRPEGLGVRVPGAAEAGGSSSQRRKQGLPQHRDAHFSDRDASQPSPLLAAQTGAPHIALGPHLRPPFLGVPPALCQTPGYGFLQPAQAEIFARQQELLRKQNLARLEMSAELQRQRLLVDTLGLPPGLPTDHPALRSLQDLPEGHPLREELSRRGAMLVLRHSTAPLLSFGHQGAVSCTATGDPGPRKNLRKGVSGDQAGESKEVLAGGWLKDGDADGLADAARDSESETEASEDKPAFDRHAPRAQLASAREAAKPSLGGREQGAAPAQLSASGSAAEPSSPSHPLFTLGIGKNEAKYLPATVVPPLPTLPTLPALPTLPGPTLPFSFPYTSPYLHTGAMGGLFLDGEDVGPVEDISKWTVEDVCSFVGGLAGCSEYVQVFQEQGIDGETLLLLTEEHLLNTMGLKLGPALKIRSQVARRAGRILYMTSLPLALPLPPSVLRPADRDQAPSDTRPLSAGVTLCPAPGRPSPKHENGFSATSCDGAKHSC
uniref:Sterile alpha motif domain containing 11 n=1 Tax=Paramormyrops kingsleyae TaxID=1676925 RepID=A0A3B3SU73_9TELE